MKHILLHIFYLSLLIPFTGIAQEDNVKLFYSDLAKRDALQEQNLVFTNLEDCKDFWQDQNDFEILLNRRNPFAYKIYLKSKANAYNLHHLDCDANCEHDENYLSKKTFYMLNGAGDTKLSYTSSKRKKPQIRD
ncbi:hypothetical protein [uncultured Croceitalea sp.]|uniref:hypothetical protein n=1 Tax=uncultured Croceitalea sp. TaxID=1798908 RepID=UPI00374E817D